MLINKWYRRYRYENRYDAPFKILLIDTMISVSKLGVLLLVFFAGWLGFKYFTTSEFQQKSLDTALVVAPQANMSNKQVALVENGADTDIPVIEEGFASEEPAVVENKTSRVVGEKWILSQESSAYILQFGSSLDDIELIKEFIPIIKSDQPIAIFQFKKTQSGRPVYGVASGVFDDLDSALASIELLTEAERQYDPWVRPLRELQRQVSTVVASSSG